MTPFFIISGILKKCTYDFKQITLCVYVCMYFRERVKEGEKEGEKQWSERETMISCLSHVPQSGTQTYNAGKCPDQESNRRPFVWWDDSQPTEPHWSGLEQSF